MNILKGTLLSLMLLSTGSTHADTNIGGTGIKVVKTYSVGAAPHGMRLDGDSLLTTLSGEEAVLCINLETGAEPSRWSVPGVPLDVIRSKNNWLVTTLKSAQLIELDGATGKELARWTEPGEQPSKRTMIT